MWLFTKYGFFSATSARTGNGSHGNPLDVDRIMVRSRWHSHLVNLRKRFKKELKHNEIYANAGTDYRYRIFVHKAVWKKIVAALAEETDYDNFKSEAGRYEEENQAPDEGYLAALHDVWTTVYKYRNRAIHPAPPSLT